MKNHDQELRNIGTANNRNQKKHDFQTMAGNQEFMVFIGCADVSELLVMVFIGFYNVSELLTMKTIVKTNKNHEFSV